MRVLASAVFICAAAAAEEARPWGLPEEVASGRAERKPAPIEIVKTPSGAVGVFVFIKETGLTLQASEKGTVPWKLVMLPLGLPGNPEVDGDLVRLPVTDFEKESVALLTFDLVKGERTARIVVPGKFPSMPLFTRWARVDRDACLVVSCERGEVLVSRSADGGGSWSEAAQVAVAAVRDDAVSPPLVVNARGFQLLTADADGSLVQRVSPVAGGEWAVQEKRPLVPEDVGPPSVVNAAAAGRNIHVVAMTKFGKYAYWASRDDGATWQLPKTLAKARDCDLTRIFQVRAAGDVVTLAYTVPGNRDTHPKKAKLLVSRDAGLSWEESAVDEGLARDSGFPAIWIEPGGALLAALCASAPENSDAESYALVRRLRPAGAERPRWPAGTAVPDWWAR